MIYYVATERHIINTRKFLHTNPEMKKVMATLSYEELFFLRGGPVGHYIFTDLDRLTRFELDCVSYFCDRLREVAPDTRLLNLPAKVKDRFPLLVALQKMGINSFSATRIETGERPPKYPVFIRSVDGCRGPETDLIKNADEYDQALEDLKLYGKARRDRIAIGYAAKAGPDGYFRKYGAYKIGADILPHHIHLARHWVVKRNFTDAELMKADAQNVGLRESAIQEELEYVRDNPHRDTLRKVFEIAETDFGRVDYTVIDGRIEIYEINTNPKLPRFMRSDARNSVREITKPQILGAFRALDTPIKTKQRFVRFKIPHPIDHKFRLPIIYLPRAIWRGAFGMFGR